MRERSISEEKRRGRAVFQDKDIAELGVREK